MAAGLGFKDFVTGEVLTAADVDGYLMQGVWVFASAAARDAAVTSPQEGNFAYLKDTNVTTYYTGSAWANLDTTGMTNPMTTTGDTIYSSSGSTPARLGIGSTGQVLTVAGGVPTWASAGGGGANWSLLNAGGTALSGSSTVTVSGISGKDKIWVLIDSATTGTGSASVALRVNTDSGSNYVQIGFRNELASSYNVSGYSAQSTLTATEMSVATTGGSGVIANGLIMLTGCNASGVKQYSLFGSGNGTAGMRQMWRGGVYTGSSTISSISVIGDYNFTGGTVYVYTSA
jgi:hypothetical protein